ncbi:MAG: sugar kinase [Rhodobacteraceae bacterium]|nr:sugar kinase [Paracoccaceae bacterium]
MRFMAIGECMAELAPAVAAREYRLGFAGDTFNTAWYLRQLAPEVPVAFFSGVGSDQISADLRGFMEEAGIDASALLEVPDRTLGLYMISLVDGERSFAYWRGQSAARCLADDEDALEAAVAGSDFIFFSGITLGILDAAARGRLFARLGAARAAGATIAFDPNLRPRLWASTDEMMQAIMDGAAVSDVVLPSYEDEADWFGDTSPSATTDRYAAVGVSTIVVKNGAEAVEYLADGERGEVAVEALASVVDTTAAGDSFNAGVFAGLAKGADLPSAIQQGCSLARHVVQGKGALVSL